MDTAQQSIADRLKQANNILVTVSANPSVDQLAACIGLTLAFNKLGKHATAVFSGVVPSTIEFLQPEKTIEKNTDSLRDFIIALDKSKADKLRYKVEDKIVKIFITPYRTSITEKDLDFSQGDFNVDVVLALGVQDQAHLDQAITAHGRILHDATVATINVKPGGELGSLNWVEPAASSLSELAVEICDLLDDKIIDGQIATSFLTGIVAETSRFSNAKTSPQTMSISAELMSLGANQQLVAAKLEEPVRASTRAPQGAGSAAQSTVDDDGTLEIAHTAGPQPPAPESSEQTETPQIHINEQGEFQPVQNEDTAAPPAAAEPPSAAAPTPEPSKIEQPLPQHIEGPRMILQPPTFEGELTANAKSEDEEAPSGDPLASPSQQQEPLLEREPLAPPSSKGVTVTPPNETEPGQPPAELPKPDKSTETLDQLEHEVDSPHLTPTPQPSVDLPSAPAWTPPDISLSEPSLGQPDNTGATDAGAPPDPTSARDAVAQALQDNSSNDPLTPIQALNAQMLGDSLHQNDSTLPAPEQTPPGAINPAPAPSDLGQQPGDAPLQNPGQTLDMPLPGFAAPAPPIIEPTQSSGNADDGTLPPPVPPPMLPPIPS